MSNIRAIGDPAIATAMLATMQSIDAARSAPSGISEPRWRILQCIAKAAPNVPSPGELRLCSGLNKAALAEHVQALQWKGLLEMGGYRLSPSAAAMVGLEQPYAPKDAKMTKFADIRGRSGTVVIDEFSAIESAAAAMDPADVPACMRPDCTPPVLDHAISTSHLFGDRPNPMRPQIKSRAERVESAARRRAATAALLETNKETNDHGRGGAAAAHPTQRDVHRDRVATDRALRTTEEVAGSNPAPGQPATLTPELVTSLRAAIPPRKSPAPVEAPKESARVVSGDAWEMQARRGSEELLRAIRRHHPERCGGR